MRIRVYLTFLIPRLQISKFNKKLYSKSKLLPVANKINQCRYKSSLNDFYLFLSRKFKFGRTSNVNHRVFLFLLTFVVIVGFFPVFVFTLAMFQS